MINTLLFHYWREALTFAVYLSWFFFLVAVVLYTWRQAVVLTVFWFAGIYIAIHGLIGSVFLDHYFAESIPLLETVGYVPRLIFIGTMYMLMAGVPFTKLVLLARTWRNAQRNEQEHES